MLKAGAGLNDKNIEYLLALLLSHYHQNNKS